MSKVKQKVEVAEIELLSTDTVIPNAITDPIECVAKIVDQLKPHFEKWTKRTLPPFDYGHGFLEEGKSLKSPKVAQIIMPSATTTNRHILIVRWREATLRQIVEAIAGVLPHAVTGTDHDKAYAEVHKAFDLGQKLRQPTPGIHLSKVIDDIVANIGGFPQKWVRYEALIRNKKGSVTDGSNTQVGRMLKVICRECAAKPGTKGNILRQSELAILSYGIGLCRVHGDMIVELKKKDQPVAQGIPSFVVDADPVLAPDLAEEQAGDFSAEAESDGAGGPPEPQPETIPEPLEAAE